MNKDSWISLIIAGAITILATAALYYSHGPIGSKEKLSEGSGSKTIEPMKRSNGNESSTSMGK